MAPKPCDAIPDPAMPDVRRLILLAAALHAGTAFAGLWAYVDAQGHSHVANRQIDARYKLFFKGETTLDVPRGPARRARPRDRRARGHTALPARDRPCVAQRYAPLIETSARATGSIRRS